MPAVAHLCSPLQARASQVTHQGHASCIRQHLVTEVCHYGSICFVCRSLTLRCCVHSLSEEFSNLRSLEHLDIMDPYQDLRVLQQMSPLTWLRVFVHGHYDPDECLAFTFPPSLHFLELRCNRKRYSRTGSVYLQRPDPVRPLCCNELIHLLKLLEDLSRDSFCYVAVPHICWLQQALWTAQYVSGLSSYAGHLFVMALWMSMVRLTSIVDLQDLLKACFQLKCRCAPSTSRVTDALHGLVYQMGLYS